VIAEAARIAAESDISPLADIHASAAYRRHLARVLVRRALILAVERATQPKDPA
jgi:aerobic carbon-monoxide dehydrogenase medium subunit